MSKNTQHELEEKVELYVIGALSNEERQAFETHLITNKALQKRVNDFQETLLQISDQLPLEKAPQPLGARIERSLDALHKKPSSQYSSQIQQSSPAGGFWQNLTLWRGFALAGFLTSAVLSVQLMQYTSQAEPETRYVAVLVEPQDKSPGWVIQTSQSRQIELIPLGAVEIPEGKALQFWTKAEGWDKPISLGLVKKGQPITVDIDQLPPLEANQLFELTIEDEAGSPTGLPTGPIYSIGRGLTL
ncbi:anti-sigma factor [Thiomicrorhabdus indica]|uniref:anti-sigma factor n=1 Tax=Thiomicrorhabdus indica TaxID=2267253 RepID=UPI00102E0F7E|nr:anti-sigma factor [Thiomicrorhabdus indica]